MRNFTKYLLTMMVILLSSSVMLAQLQVSSSGCKATVLPESRAVLYQQTNSSGVGRASQDFESAYDAYDCEGADDFFVPAGTMWNIQTVTATGTQSLTTTISVANVIIYADAGGLPAATATNSLIGLTCSDATGVLTIPIPGGLFLGPGHWWIAVQDAADYATYGQWYWTETTTIFNSQSCWRNPNGGFGGPYVWTPMVTLGYPTADFLFRLEGTSAPAPACQYMIALYDAFGDGWNGCSIDVLVDGVIVLNDITLSSGSGPANYYFPVTYGASITTTFTSVSWPCEPYYYVYNSTGQQVFYVPAYSSCFPEILAGQLNAVCPLIGAVEGYVFNYDGLAIAGAIIGVQSGPTTTSGPNGYYLLTGVNSGSTTIGCTKSGYNPALDVVAVVAGDTVTHDFTLTQPNMVINPLYIEETLNPGEFFTTSLNVLNNGNGPLGWEAVINYPPTDNGGGNYVVNPPGYQTQQVPPNGAASTGYGTGTETGSRDFMVCPDGSLFSIPPVSVNNGYTSTQSAGYKCSQSFSGLTDPISTVNFWGIFAGYTLPTSPGNFLIELCEPGSVPGAVVTSVTVPLVGVNTGQVVVGSYQLGFFTTEVPPTDLPAGWLSVQFLSSPIFYWCNTQAGAGFPAQQNGGTLPERLAMCLAGGGGGAGNWLTMDYYDGIVPAFGGVANIPTHLDAAGTEPGQVYTADIVFTSTPFVGEITVPVTMIILGPTLVAPTNLTVTLINDVTGQVGLTWEWTGDAFQFFMVKRDGLIVGTTTLTHFTDILPTYGEYCYTVQAVYDEGQTAPAGPECIEWPNPTLFVNPTALEGWVWVDHQVKVYTTISNIGIGTLHYTFPDFAASDNLPASSTIDLPAGPATAAENTAVAGGTFKARPESTYTLNRVRGGRAGVTVLLVAADPANTIHNLLEAYGDLATVDYYDARNGTPSLGQLEQYNVVVTWSNYTYNNATAMGDVLADYIDNGGRVINLMFALDPSWGLSGRFVNEGYTAMTGTGTAYTTSCLGSYDPTHPIMAGVTNVCDGYRLANSGLTSGSTVIARWSDNLIFVAVKDDHTVVSIGGYAGDSYNYSGQEPDVIHNAILWVAGGGNFIVTVNPATSNVASGESQLVEITYDATGFDPGVYTEDLEGQSNDPAHADFIIGNTMHVYVPAQFAGMVYDRDDSSPISGALVTAGPFQTTTDEAGEYIMYVDEGTYDVVFEKLGYMTVTVADTLALQGVVTPVSVGMWDNNYAPGFVHAEVMANDTWVNVTWSLPEGPYEIVMDDGEADDYFIWGSIGNMDAVKFTPTGYPATAIGGQIYVGDGSFPGPFLGSEFGIAIFDDDGPNGLPGTMLDSSGVTVNNYGWITFDWLNAPITSGSFYLAMIQTAASPNAAPMGIDLDNPTYFKSYIFMVGSPSWVMSPLQDFMIRAWVSGPESDGVTDAAPAPVWRATPRVPANWQHYAMTKSGTLPRILPAYERNDVSYRGVEGMDTRNVTNYRVARYSNFDPNGSPAAGTISELGTTGNLYYEDHAWIGLPQGWYAYGVKALYTSGIYSNYAISNIVGHLMDFQVTVNVTLSTNEEPSNVEVTLQGLEYPYSTLFAVTPASGTVVFDPVWRGHYDISAMKIGYDTYKINNAFINADKVYDIVLGEKKYPPTCLVVDPVSLIATWCEPLRTALDQNFEAPTFPPGGWTVTTQGDGAGWERTDDGSSANWPVPSWDSFYAVSNDDAAGSLSDGCCDYLITPAVDLRESLGYMMKFNSYYDGAFGELAFVEYSTDGGATWEVLNQISPATSWSAIEIDLATFSGLSGPAQIMFAFHADDAGAMASGWAVDDVKIQVPTPAAHYLDFWVFLDNAFEGITTETTWNYAPILYGTTHTASVAARYSSGLSNKDYYTFFCKYLFPPDSLRGTAPDDAAILTWNPPLEYWPPMQATQGMSYDEYLAANNLQNIRSNDAPSAGRAPYANLNAPDANPFEGLRDLESKAWACDALAVTMVTFTLGTPGTLNLLGPGAGDFIASADIVDGVYYGTIYGGTFVTMDTNTGAFTTIGSTADLTGMAYDYTTSTMFGVDFGGSLYTIDLETGAATVVGNTGGVLIDCAVDNEGILYAVDIGSDVFGSIDKVTAQFTTIANLPFDANYAQGMQCDHVSDVVYHAAYNNSMGAGQLYSVEQTTGTYTLIGNFQGNTEVDGMAMPGGSIIPVPVFPENLLGYNVYRDGDFVAYTPHTPVGEYVLQGYVDQGLQPGIYQYTVTGVYDLAPYGYAGETGESMEEGPWPVTVKYCYELEFVENWGLGNFEDNSWLTDGSNWTVNGQSGHPAPAAEFTWDPIQTNYESSLTSYPLCAVGLTEGKIWLDFDLKLNSVQPTGEELIQAQVWNWETQVWNTVSEYSNVDGSFDWISEHISIKPQAMDKVFKIRFHATGVNSINILGWFVDNIHVYRACEAASALTAEALGNQHGIVLNWTEPDLGQIDTWIHWDDGVFSGTSVGTGNAVEFDVAARWEPAQLAEYDGASVTQISYFPVEPTATYRVRVWIGAGAANLVCDQAVTPTVLQWNTATLTTPVPIDITQELWVGYYVNTPTGYPAGVDAGPAVDGYGDMMNFGGWQTLLQINPELDFNWNLTVHLMTVAGVTMPLGRTIEPYNNHAGLSMIANPNPGQTTIAFTGGNGSRDFSGYNIYRSAGGADYVLYDFTTSTTYTDTEEDLIIGTNYCYMVSAVYTSETDLCESAFSNEACDVWTSITEPNANPSSFSLYPNPADDHVYITTSGDLKRVTVYNALGQLVTDEITTGKQYELATTSYTIGVYMVRVETAAGITTRTLTIQR